jgi:hypothetical protein
MRVQFPTPGDILFAIALLTFTTWQAQVVLAVVALLFLGSSHWIIGGLFGAVAVFAYGVRRRFRL